MDSSVGSASAPRFPCVSTAFGCHTISESINLKVVSRPISGSDKSYDRAVSWLTVESFCVSCLRKLDVPVLLITFIF